MANAVKFRAQVLGQKATHLVRPYRACHCFTTQTQGDALGFHRTPRWGWEGRVRDAASPRWGWGGVVRDAASALWGWEGVIRHAAFCPVGGGEAWFVTRLSAPWGWEGVVRHAAFCPLGLGRRGS